jgi:hypothetical protein
MAMEASSQGLKKWVVVGAAAGVLGCGFSALLLFGPPRWGGVPLSPPPPSTPVPIGVSDVSAGMSTGFTRPRPAMRKNEDLKAVLPEWCHLVAKGDQSLSPPSLREAWYDILVGPSDAAVPNITPAQIEGHFSNPHVRLDNGIGYLSGRWIIPRTRRIRGVSPGGNLYGAGVVGGAPQPEPIDPASCAIGDDQVIEGRIVVFTDKTRDIVFFAPDAVPSTMTLVLKQWMPGSTNPRDEEPPLADTLFECQQITSGNYYIVTFDSVSKKQTVATKPWNLTSGTHGADVKEIITRVNAKVDILNHLTVVKRLPVLTP